MSYSTFYLNSQSSDGIIDGSNVIIGGNVGIQTNTPEYSLDINGTFRSSSIVTPNLNVENIILTDSSLNPYSIQSRIEHTKLVENIVTVGTKTSDAANSSGSSSAFFIDNIETPYLHFTLGKTYRFIQTDSTNTGHPLRFYLDEGKTTQFTTNVTVSGTPGVDSTAYVEISVTSSTPQILYYQCSSHSYMGNAAYSKSTSGLNNISVNDLSDVSFNSTTAEDGNALVWNATSGEWEAGIIVSNKPAFQGVDLSGYDLLLKFTENIKNVSTYDPTDFTVNVKSVNRSVDSIAIANGDVNLIMDTGGQIGGVETLIGGLVGGAIGLDVNGSIEDSRLDHYLRGLSFYGDYLYVCVPNMAKIRRFNIVTQIWSTFVYNTGSAIGGITRDGINFYVVYGASNSQKLVKFPMNYDNFSDTYLNRIIIYNPLPVTDVKSFTMSNDGAYIYFGITDDQRRLGITRYTISTGVFEYYKTGGLTTNSYSSDEDYLLYNVSYKYNIRLAIDDNYLYFGYNWWVLGSNGSKIGRISLSTDAIELSWKTEESSNSWFVGSVDFPHDDNSYQTMVYKDGYLYFNGPSSTGKIVKTSVNDSTNTVTEVGDYVGHIAIHPTLPYLYFAGFYQWYDFPYDEPSRKGTVWQLTLDVPSYQTFDPITSVDNLTIKYVKNSTSSKNLLGDPSEFVVDNFNYVGTDITGIINGADISFNSIEASSIVINGDLSANDASLNVIDAETIFIEGSNVTTSLNSKQATITETIDVSLNNLKVHGDLSANDASFNVIDVSAIFIQGRDLVGDGVSEAMDTLKELADALDSSANFAANVTTRLATIESDLANKQTTISTNDLSLGDISGLYTQLASKQDTISTNDLSLGDISGLYTQLAIKQTTISTNDLSLGDISGLYTQLASKQDTISTNDLSLGDISGLYTQLDSKQDTLTAGTDISITNNTISYTGSGGGSGGGGSGISSGDDVSFNNLDISGVLGTNKSNNQISLGGHIIPTTNSTYDLGSAEYKIRHLYLSNNSLWLGEDHKIEVSDGKMKFRKLQKNALPSGLNAISGASISDAITVLGKPSDTPASSFTLADWEAYSIAKGSPLRVDEIFLSDDINDDNGVLDTINGLDISLNVIDASMINVSGDISANDASFNVIDASAIFIQGRDLVGPGVSSALDTLKELADALDSSANFSANVTTRLNTIETDIAGKQDTLTAGTNITITDNTISASGSGSADITESSITDLSDVDISYSNISDGQSLIWNDASGVWKPGIVSSGSGTTIDSDTDISVNNLDVSGNLEVGSVIIPASPAYTISYEYHNWDKHGGGPFVSNYGSNNTYKTGSYLTSDSTPDRMQTDGLWSGANTQTFSMKDISGNNGSISNVVALFYRGTSNNNTLELTANGVSSSVSTSQQNDTGYTYYFELRDPWTTPSAHRHPIEYIIAGTEDDLGTTREFIGTIPTSSHVTEINNMNWKMICRYHFTDDNNYWNSVSSDIYDPDASQLDLSYCTVYDSGASFTDINGRNTQVGSGHNKYYYVLKTTTPNLPLYKGFCVFIIDSTASNVALKSFNIQVEKFNEAVSEHTVPIMSVNNTKCLINLPIDISGTVNATGSIIANTTITNSDDRLKHNEKLIDNAISIINKLNPMRYFKTAELKDKSYNFPLDISGVPITTMNYHEETGIIAQDIYTIPELSYTLRVGNDNMPYGIDYNSIFCTHIAATKELYSIINNQKLMIEQQEQEIENLKLANQDMNNQLNTVLNENNTLKDDIIFIKNYLGIN